MSLRLTRINRMRNLLRSKEIKFLGVGLKERINDFTGPGIKLVDCGGKTMVPGFNDAHCHIFSFMRTLTSVDLSQPQIKSIRDIQAVIKEKAGKSPPVDWITGTDYNEFYLAEKRHPTRWELDEVARTIRYSVSPLFTRLRLEQQGTALAGITIETPEPPGTMIGRDVERGGEPNGFLVEMLGYIREKVMPPISGEELDHSIKLANREYLSRGLTSLQDATVVNDLKRWRYYHHFKERSLLKSRVYMMIGTETMKEFQAAGLSFSMAMKIYASVQLRLFPA